jgi:prevent-host-death family protein
MNMNAAEFKSHCLAVMDRVQKTREAVLITKRGKPVARLVPVSEKTGSARLFGCLRNTAVFSDDLTAPSGVKWNAEKGLK